MHWSCFGGLWGPNPTKTLYAGSHLNLSPICDYWSLKWLCLHLLCFCALLYVLLWWELGLHDWCQCPGLDKKWHKHWHLTVPTVVNLPIHHWKTTKILLQENTFSLLLDINGRMERRLTWQNQLVGCDLYIGLATSTYYRTIWWMGCSVSSLFSGQTFATKMCL